MSGTIVISLFDLSGAMVEPWVASGRTAFIVDVQHPAGVRKRRDGLYTVGADIRSGFDLPDADIEFMAAFPPCDHLAVSGARWFKGKGLRALSLSVDLFATAAEACEASGAPYQIENPVSTISTYWRKPDFTFHPWHFAGLEPGDHYTKKTCLWVGCGFVMPQPVPLDTGRAPDDRIHKAPPGPDRANFRSVTPSGYARAVFEANRRDR